MSRYMMNKLYMTSMRHTNYNADVIYDDYIMFYGCTIMMDIQLQWIHSMR